MDNYITLKETAEKWGLSERRVRFLCEEGRVDGAIKFGRAWAIPIDCIKLKDKRISPRAEHPPQAAVRGSSPSEKAAKRDLLFY